MGDYYRTKPVYILRGNHLDIEPYKGMDVGEIDYYMEQFFDYVNTYSSGDSEIAHFIKLQVMHFYFVYIHPYFDVNGRTSRTVAMWYLLNNKVYPYIIFNRAISFAKREYEENIIKGRNYGDITLFLKYMLVNVEKELEKEYLIYSIREKAGVYLSKEDSQMIEYLLSMRGNLTAKDLTVIYNNYNESRKAGIVFEEKIVPLLDKGIFVNRGYTNGYIMRGQHNLHIGINPEMIDVDKGKVKHLELGRFLKNEMR